MKRTTLAVLMIALAILAMAAPLAYAQAPAPKVTINGLIDNVTSYSENIANYNGGVFNRKDQMWYLRTRGRFDFIGEVGKAKGVLGIELDHVYGQAGSNDSTIVNAGAAVLKAIEPPCEVDCAPPATPILNGTPVRSLSGATGSGCAMP